VVRAGPQGGWGGGASTSIYEWPLTGGGRTGIPGVEKFVSSQPQYSLCIVTPSARCYRLCAKTAYRQIGWFTAAQCVLSGQIQAGRQMPALLAAPPMMHQRFFISHG